MCSVNECERPVLAKQMCGLHYKRMWKTGTVKPSKEFHNMYRTSEHTAWANMVARCYKPTNRMYKNYGGRGISVYEPWRKSFMAFYKALGPKPSPKHTLERINVDGNYEPSNCTWATYEAQANNKTNNRLLHFDGKTMTVSQWARELNLNINTLKTRLNLYHWTTDRALSTKVKRKYSNV